MKRYRPIILVNFRGFSKAWLFQGRGKEPSIKGGTVFKLIKCSFDKSYSNKNVQN